MLKILIVPVIVGLLSACSFKMVHVNEGAQPKLEPEHGLIVIGIKTNTPFKSIQIAGDSSSKIGLELLKQADPYFVATMPAGEYEFSRIWLNDFFYVRLNDEQNWSFKVKPNEITYIGDFMMRKLGNGFYLSNTLNNSTSALEFLEDKHSELLEKYQLSYAGSDKDLFFEYLEKLKDKAE
jgi:hypothetical protein